MERFRELLENRHQYARDWRVRTGGKVLSHFYTHLPEEIAYAAGVLPVRLLAQHEPDDISDRYMYGNCRPSRDILVQAIKGRYDYVDGIVYTEGCQWMRHTFSTWQLHMPVSYSHYVFLPDYVEGHRAKILLRSELSAFKKSLEAWTGNTITEQALDRAIEVYNTNRRLMRQVYQLRRLDNPLVSGAEAMEMVLSSQIMDKEEHNQLLAEAIKKLPERKDKVKPRARLMLVGSETHDTKLEKLVESLGATIVIDELSNGSSYFWNDVVPIEDHLMAIALRCLDKPRDPLKDIGWPRRPARIVELAEDFNVQGVIIAKQKFCHPHGTANPSIWSICRERGLPFYYFESDTTVPNAEMQTGIEAFLDMLQPALV